MKNPDSIEDYTAIRPRFEYTSNLSIEKICSSFEDVLKDTSSRYSGYVHSPYITVYPQLKDQHYWSPQLSLMIDEEEGELRIHGRYGPRPAVWTMYVFFYAVIGVASVIIGVIGLANLSLGEPAGILWLLPLLVAIFLSLYLVAFVGQKKGHDQMAEMQEIVDQILA